MQPQNVLLSTLLLLPFTFAAPSSLKARQTPVKPCSHNTGGVHVIVTPGAGHSSPPFGLLHTLAERILQRIPGSTNVSVPYNHDETNGITKATQASANLMQYIQQYHDSCPTTKIVLLGYSSGGISTLNTLCGTEGNSKYNPQMPGLSTATYGSSIIANVLYGEETRTAGASYNYGTCTGSGEHPRADPAGCDPWANKIRSYCDSQDPYCCATTGMDSEQHYVYPSEYDKTASDFVMRRLGRAGGA